MLDLLLDQEGLEVDPVDRLEADTPLHKAVRFVNGLPRPDWESGSAVVELLLDAGADPRSVVTSSSRAYMLKIFLVSVFIIFPLGSFSCCGIGN